MTKKFVYLFALLMLLLTGCNSQKKAQKKLSEIQKEHPELFNADTSYVVEAKTIYVAVPKLRLDTIIEINSDTIFITKDNVGVQVIQGDKETRIIAECTPDSIPVHYTDTIQLVKQQTITKYVEVNKIPFIVKLIVLLWVLSILHFIYRFYKHYFDGLLDFK